MRRALLAVIFLTLLVVPSFASLDFIITPLTPHIEENITTTCVDCADHTAFWWDFDDGSDLIYQPTNITVGHIYWGGGSYNITLTATNSTGTNETAYNLSNITEPDIYIWLNDTINDELLTAFSLTVWNTTHSFNFSTAAAFSTWNYTSGPSGNVTILAIKDGYNTTTESTYISNSTDLNYTVSALPAILRIWPVDYDYRNVPVPISVSLTNASTSLYDSVDYVLFDSAYASLSYTTGVKIVCSEYLTGQLFKYTLSVASVSVPDSGSISNSSIILTNEDETYNKTIDFVLCGYQTCSKTANHFLYLSKDGTYKVLNTDGTTNSTGTFPYFPGKVIGNSHVYIPSGNGQEFATTTIYKIRDSFSYFLSDANMPLGAVNLLVGQETGASFGYLQNQYSTARRYFNILPTSYINTTIYLVPTTYTSTITFSVVDNNDNPVEGAVVTLYKLFDYDLEIIGSAVTDSIGTVQFNGRVGDIYYFSVVGDDSTVTGTVYLTAGGVAVRVRLSAVGQLYPTSPELAGVSISLTPPGGDGLFQDNSYWFNLTVLDTNSYLNYTFFSIEYDDLNLSILNTSTAESGVAFSNYVSIPELNTSNPIYVTFGFWHGANSSVMKYYTFSEIYYVYEEGGLKKFVDLVPEIGEMKWIFALIIVGIGYAAGPIFGLGTTIIAFILQLIGLDILLVSGIIAVVMYLNTKEGL